MGQKPPAPEDYSYELANKARRRWGMRQNQAHMQQQIAASNALHGDPDELHSLFKKGVQETVIFDPADTVLGVGRGLNNAAHSIWALTGHGVFGLPQHPLGWGLMEDNRSVIGGLGSGIAQFAAPYIASTQGGPLIAKGFRALLAKAAQKPVVKGAAKKGVDPKKGPATPGMANRAYIKRIIYGLKHGMVSDFVGIHPKQGNLSNVLISLGQQPDRNWEQHHPEFMDLLKDYAKDTANLYGRSFVGQTLAVDKESWNDEDMRIHKQFEDRLRGLGEGALIGGGLEAFIRLIRVSSLKAYAVKNEWQLKRSYKEIQDLYGTQSSLEAEVREFAGEVAEGGGVAKAEDLVFQQRVLDAKIKEKEVELLAQQADVVKLMDKADAAEVNINWKDDIKEIREQLSRSATINSNTAKTGGGDLAPTGYSRWDENVEGIPTAKEGELEGYTGRRETAEGGTEFLVSPRVAGGKVTGDQVIRSLKGVPQEGDTVIWTNRRGKQETGGTIIGGPNKKGQLKFQWIDESGKKQSKWLSPAGLKRAKKGLEEDPKGHGLLPIEGTSEVWERITKEVPEDELRKLLDSPKKVKAFLVMVEKARARLAKAKGTGSGKGGKTVTGAADLEFEALRAALIDVKWAAPFPYGGKLEDVNFSVSKSPRQRGNLWGININPKTNEVSIQIDDAALKMDYATRMKHARGLGSSPLTNKTTASSMEEAEIFRAHSLDPDALFRVFQSTGGDTVEGLHMYRRFIELRARHIVKIAKQRQIPLSKLSVWDPATKGIYTMANHAALFNPTRRGGLNMGNNKGILKAAGAKTLTPSGVTVNVDAVFETFFKKGPLGEPSGLVQLQNFLENAKAKGLSKDELLEKMSDPKGLGKLYNFVTGPEESNAFMVGLAELLPREFNLKFKTERSHAMMLGWVDGETQIKAGISPETGEQLYKKASAHEYMAAHADESIDFLLQYSGIPVKDRQAVMDTFAKGEGGLTGIKGKKIEWELDKTNDLSKGDLRILSGRILAARVRINGRSMLAEEAGNNLLKKMKEGKATIDDEVNFARMITQQLYDLHTLSEARSAAGRNLAAFGKFDDLMKNPGQLTADEIHGIKAKLIEKFGGSQSITDMATAITAAKKEFRAAGGGTTEAALREAEIMGGASGWDLLNSVNDIWINAMLSGLRTHVINNTSTMIKGALSQGWRWAATWLPERGFSPLYKGWNGMIDPVSGEKISAAVAQMYARDESKRTLMYMMSYGFDVVRTYLRGARSEADFASADALQSHLRKSAERDAQLVADADKNPTGSGILEGQGDAGLEGVGPSQRQGGASAAAIGGGLRKLASGAGKGAYQTSLNWSRGAVFGTLSTLWDGFYQGILRQPIRKMVASDQLHKRVMLTSNLTATLWAHARSPKGRNMSDEREIAKWVADASENLVLPNGTPFSEKNLRTFALEKGMKAGLKEQELRDFAENFFNKHWNLENKEGGGIFLGGEARERLAKIATDDVQEMAFQEKGIKAAQERYDQLKKEYDDAGGEHSGLAKPKPPKGGPGHHLHQAASNNPVMRIFFPFLQTQNNLIKDAISMFPFTNYSTSKYHAAINSGVPSRVADAYGRQLFGAGITMGAFGLAYKGIITGGGPRDPRAAKTLRGTGWKPYAIRLPDGRYLEYGRLEPVSTLFKIAAEQQEVFHAIRNDPKAQALYADLIQSFSIAVGESLINNSYSKNISELITVINNMSSTDLADVHHNSNYLEKYFGSFTPNIVEGPTGSIDKDMREIRGFWDVVMNRMYPWGVPKQRDPIFGTIMPETEHYFTPGVHALTPAKHGKSKSIDPVFDEMASVYGWVAPPSIYLGSAKWGIAKTGHRAKLYNKDPKVEKALLRHARTFRAPGGALCPVRRGQDFYDFEQQYFGLRKVPWNVIVEGLSHLEPAEKSEELDPRVEETVKKFINTAGDLSKSNKPKSLRDVLHLVIASQAYQDIPKEGKPSIGEKSYRATVIKSIVNTWRKRGRAELLGEIYNVREGTPDAELTAVGGYKGIAAYFWQDMMLDYSSKDEDFIEWKRGNIGDRGVAQPQTQQNIIKDLFNRNDKD